MCEVLDANKVTINREGIERVPVNQPTVFHINSYGSPLDLQNSLSVIGKSRVIFGRIQMKYLTSFSLSKTGPNHESLRAEIEGDPAHGYKVSFTPQEVGDHVVDLKVAGASAAGCPFVIKAFDSKRVRVSEITNGQVGKPVYFTSECAFVWRSFCNFLISNYPFITVDASSAGAGNLEIIVSANGRNVPNYVQSEGNAKFRVNFKPMEAAIHNLSVKFNGESVPGRFLSSISDRIG